jgi:hypothetical protein
MHTIKTHPLTGEIIKPVGFRKPRLGETAMQPIWPIMGGDENAEAAAAAKAEADKAAADAAAKEKADAEAAAAAKAKAGGEQLPYPEGKAVADMTLEEQVAYHKYHSRKHENAWKGKFGDYTPEQVAEMAKRIEEIEAANLSDTEKAVKEAYDRGKAEATAEGASIAVRAQGTPRRDEGRGHHRVPRPPRLLQVHHRRICGQRQADQGSRSARPRRWGDGRAPLAEHRPGQQRHRHRVRQGRREGRSRKAIRQGVRITTIIQRPERTANDY